MIAKSVGVSDKLRWMGRVLIVEASLSAPPRPIGERRKMGRPTQEALRSGDTKKGGPNRLPRLACHCTNRPFFQDIYVKYLMAPAFQKKPGIFLRGANARFS